MAVFALTGLALLPAAVTFATLGRRFDEDGGPVVFARAAFGDRASFLVGWVAYVSALFSTAAVVVGLTRATLPALGLGGGLAARAAPALLVTALAAVVASGLRLSARVWTSLTVLKLTWSPRRSSSRPRSSPIGACSSRRLGVTVSIALYALAIAVALGVAISLVFVQSRWIETAFTPYVVLLQVTPIVAIAPLIILWVQDTRTALVLCAVVVAIFPIISNTTLGLRSVDPGLLNLFRMHRATRLQVLLRLRVPSPLRYFFGGLPIASGLALIGAVVAEFVAGTGGQGAGLAYQIAASPATTAASGRR